MISDLCGARTGVSEISAVESQVRGGLSQIREDCLKCRSIPLNVMSDRIAIRITKFHPPEKNCHGSRSAIWKCALSSALFRRVKVPLALK